MPESPRISVIVPTREEAGCIGGVVRGALRVADEVLVVDGHSTDGTREAAEAAGARVILDRGRGKGDAVRLGLETVQGRVAVVIDADGSHDPADIPRLAEPILTGEAHLVVGSRLQGGSEELHGDLTNYLRMVGAGFMTLVVNLRFGTQLTDILNGFRAIRREEALELGLRADGFTIEQEMVVRSLKRGLRVREVPTHERARQAGVSKLPTAKGLLFLARLLVEIW